MKFTVYREDTGEIVRTGECEEDSVHLQAGPGEKVIKKYALDGNKKRIDLETGKPVNREKSEEELWVEIRIERDKRLASCDWTQVADARVDQQAWAQYREELRDLPDNINPRSFTWPTPPQR